MPLAWSRIEIEGHPADALLPEGARFALLWLHSQAEESAADHPHLKFALEAHKLACVAPRPPSDWWVSPDVERRLLKDVVPWMSSRWRGIGVAGIEMGGQGALRLGLKHPSRFRAAAGLGSAIDFHELHGRGTILDTLYPTKERARQDTATLHMHPSEWPPYFWFACDPANPWFRGNDRLHEKHRAYGVPHTADLESSETNWNGMIAFLAEGLDRESRRLM